MQKLIKLISQFSGNSSINQISYSFLILITLTLKKQQIKFCFWFNLSKTFSKTQVESSSSSSPSIAEQQQEEALKCKKKYQFFLKAMKQENDKVIEDINNDPSLLSAHLNNFCWQVLHIACHTGNYALVQWLLTQKQIEISVETTSGHSPKALAQRKGFTKIVQLIETKERMKAGLSLELKVVASSISGDQEN